MAKTARTTLLLPTAADNALEELKKWAELYPDDEDLPGIIADLEKSIEVHTSPELPAEEKTKLIGQARDMYAASSSDDIEVDDDARFSVADNGTWVSAWLWVPEPEDTAIGD